MFAVGPAAPHLRGPFVEIGLAAQVVVDVWLQRDRVYIVLCEGVLVAVEGVVGFGEADKTAPGRALGQDSVEVGERGAGLFAHSALVCGADRRRRRSGWDGIRPGRSESVPARSRRRPSRARTESAPCFCQPKRARLLERSTCHLPK